MARRQRAVIHGVVWAVAVSAAAYLLTARTATAAVSQGILSAVLYASLVYAWNPYRRDESSTEES